eukprot:TRINITY_DN952_c0_g1_i4.p1 TRINITY_DN952_c0_g1~~TRINITY_DN952_c0_g1_i4.p1  ORF type:complete len:265 (-),score=81.48 TRINITY_DN952_c0_g1_i4:239-1033(-)
MAPVEIETIFENPQGFAFEVKIKSPSGESIRTPARERLESYGDSRLPHLLRIRSKDSPPRTPSKKCSLDEKTMISTSPQRAEKSRKHNEQVQEVQERLRTELDKSTTARRFDLEKSQRKAADKRQVALVERATKAGKHFEAVKNITERTQQKLSEEIAALSQKLEDAQAQKQAAALANLAERKALAERHNEAVLSKVKEHQQKHAEGTAALSQKLEESQATKYASALANLAQRKTRAEKHNEFVAGRAQQQKDERGKKALEQCQ